MTWVREIGGAATILGLSIIIDCSFLECKADG
jgi:hypothetical protein